jgi:large subunit ribosomal protein L35
MAKFKPHSGASKRFKLTGTGKLRHEKGRRRTHMMQKQATGRTRLEDGIVPVSKADTKRVRRLLGK